MGNPKKDQKLIVSESELNALGNAGIIATYTPGKLKFIRDGGEVKLTRNAYKVTVPTELTTENMQALNQAINQTEASKLLSDAGDSVHYWKLKQTYWETTKNPSFNEKNLVDATTNLAAAEKRLSDTRTLITDHEGKREETLAKTKAEKKDPTLIPEHRNHDLGILNSDGTLAKKSPSRRSSPSGRSRSSGSNSDQSNVSSQASSPSNSAPGSRTTTPRGKHGQPSAKPADVAPSSAAPGAGQTASVRT